MKKEDFQEIKKLIERGKEDLAIAYLLKKSAKTKIEHDAISLSNRYQRLKEDFSRELISKEDKNVQINSINKALLSLEGKFWKNKKKVQVSLFRFAYFSGFFNRFSDFKIFI